MANKIKKCFGCREPKAFGEFHRNKSHRYGYHNYCKDCRSIKAAEYYKKNKKRINDRCGRYLKSERGKAKWHEARRRRMACPEYRQRKREYWRLCQKKRRDDPGYRISQAVSAGICISIKNNKNRRSWTDLVGYNLEDLKASIEKQFTNGMTFENYGEWHIDHIVPLSAFNFDSAEHVDFKRAWALNNLQPLWANENMDKGTKIEKPFQPALGF